MTGTILRSDPREDEPRLVDNPFRRESHRPWYARRGPRWTVALLILALFVLNAVAFKKVSNRADPVSVDTAIARFRAATVSTTPPSTTPVSTAAAPGRAENTRAASTATHASSSAPTATAATTGDSGVERGPTPAPGVYVYDTKGYETVSALGGARHDYPTQSTITYTDNGCGVDMRWAPLEQRFDVWKTCTTGDDRTTLTSYTTHHEFFGQSEERTYVCQDVEMRPASTHTGYTSSGSCTLAPDTVATTTQVIGIESKSVDGTTVDALHLHLEQHISGESRGTQISDVWLRLSDGLLLRYITVVDGDSNTVVGWTHFHEEVNLDITDLAPLQ